MCDLTPASAKPETAWLGRSFIAFEDGLPLRNVGGSKVVRKQGVGAYVNELDTLWFSSTDGSSPLDNGRTYEARAVDGSAGILSSRWRAVALGLAILAVVVSTLLSTSALSHRVFLSVAGLCLVVQTFAALNHGVVHVDAGSSLPYAREVMEGRLPYRDFLYNFTPLGVMALAVWKRLGPAEGMAAHTFSLLLILILEGLCAHQVFKISRALRMTSPLAGVVALSYLSTFMFFDGSRMLYEPMYLLVVLIAFRIQVASPSGRSPWVAGGLASLAFLIKQYGGFAFWGALFASRSQPRPVASAAKVILGAAAGLAAVGLGLLVAGVDLRLLAAQTLTGNYPAQRESVWIRLYFGFAPFLLLAPLLFLRREWRAQNGVMALLGYLVASWMPLLVRQHQYYLQNPSPFLFLAFGTLVSLIAAAFSPTRSRWIETAAMICLVSVPVRAAQSHTFGMPPVRGVQERRARLMTSYWPSGQPVLMFASPSFLALTGYRSPDLSGLGYRFLNETSLEQVRAGMERASAAWIDPDSMWARGDFARAGTSLKEELVRHGFELQMALEDRYELWTKGGALPLRQPPPSVGLE